MNYARFRKSGHNYDVCRYVATYVIILFHFIQEVKDIYLFAIVGILVIMDIVFLIPVTIVPKARLRREYEEIEGDDVSTSYVYL